MSRSARELVILCAAAASVSGCERVLGFEDHRLGLLDGSADAVASAGASGDAGTTGGAAGSAGTGGGASAGMGGRGGEAGACLLCEVGDNLVHRYSFDGTGSQATDSVGAAHGAIIAASLSGDGTLTLSGNSQYVDLPNGIVSALGDASFEAWVTWLTASTWQRVFDFGDTTNGLEDSPGTANTSLYLTPRAFSSSGSTRVAYTASGSNAVNGQSALATGEMSQIVVVIDGITLRLYRDGTSQGFGGPIGPLSAINDINNWLGRSQDWDDPGFAGTFHEFRIYDIALSAEQITSLFEAGPDANF